MAEDKNKSLNDAHQMAKLLFAVNRLNLRAHQCETIESLTFLILNDTASVAQYDRALLWSFSSKEPKLLGVSGQTTITSNKELLKKWKTLVTDISDPKKPQVFVVERVKETDPGEDSKERPKSTILWLPILCNEKLTLGFWMELWGDHKDTPPPDDLLGLLVYLLMPSFGLAWQKLQAKSIWNKVAITKPVFALATMGILIFSLFINIPLRIVAPCEVVPLDPFVIRAPMEGIVDRIDVNPGQKVVEGDILFEFDKRVPLQQLRVAEQEVQVLKSKLNRAVAMSLEADESGAENVAVLSKQLEKEKIKLEMSRYHASLLTEKSPVNGVVIIDNVDEFTGKPVTLGEKIMAIADPEKNKVKIWIPENDNLSIDVEEAVKIILNVNPNKNHYAKISFIASEAVMSDKSVSSFIAEANWAEDYSNIKLGLKGTAIIYGEKVPLWYFFFRKPWARMRYYLGL